MLAVSSVKDSAKFTQRRSLNQTQLAITTLTIQHVLFGLYIFVGVCAIKAASLLPLPPPLSLSRSVFLFEATSLSARSVRLHRFE